MPKTVFFVLCLLPCLLSAEIQEEDLLIKKESWNIGLSQFAPINLSRQQEYLLTTIPLLLREELADIDEHILSKDEIHFIQEEHYRSQMVKLLKSRSEQHQKRDEILFSDLNQEDRDEKYRELSEKIEEWDQDILEWEALDPDDFEISESLPLSTSSFQEDEYNLLQAGSQTRRFMQKEDMDLIISGSVESLDDLFYLSINCYNRFDEASVLEIKRLCSEEEINTIILETADRLRSYILGRSWSELIINVYPENALIVIDGQTMGVGQVRNKTMKPGFSTIILKDKAHRTQSHQLYLPAEGKQELEYILEPGIFEGLYIYSEPPGADVYLGAIWMGRTPLTIEKPVDNTQIKIVKDKYMPFYVLSDELESKSITVQLSDLKYNKQIRLQQAKSDFYKSLGWFSISVSVPLILAGIYQNLDNRYYEYLTDYKISGDPQSYNQAEKYYGYSNIAYYSMWGGIAISGSLLVNSLFKLSRYMKAAEESTEE